MSDVPVSSSQVERGLLQLHPQAAAENLQDHVLGVTWKEQCLTFMMCFTRRCHRSVALSEK